MIKPMFTGPTVCWGANDDWVRLPIVNLPEDTIKIRRRIRSKSVARAFVKTSTGLEDWILAPCESGLKLFYLVGANSSR